MERIQMINQSRTFDRDGKAAMTSMITIDLPRYIDLVYQDSESKSVLFDSDKLGNSFIPNKFFEKCVISKLGTNTVLVDIFVDTDDKYDEKTTKVSLELYKACRKILIANGALISNKPAFYGAEGSITNMTYKFRVEETIVEDLTKGAFMVVGIRFEQEE